MFLISSAARLARLFAATMYLASASVHSHTGAQSAQVPDPLDPLARVPQATYRSPILDYRKLGEDQSTPWKEANETVNRIGGWRAYAREAIQGSDRPAVTPSSVPGSSDTHHGAAQHGGGLR